MKEWVLTDCELLFAAAQLGAEAFYGLPDPFLELDEEEMAQLLLELPARLEQRGVGTVGFDDGIALYPEAEKMLRVCTDCTQLLLVRIRPALGESKDIRIYCDGKECAVLEDAGEHLLKLYPVQSDEVAPILGRDMFLTGEPEKEQALLSYDVLAAAQKKAEEDPDGAADVLKTGGCGSKTAEMLVQGFRQKTGHARYCFTDFVTHDMRELTCLYREGGAVLMVPSEELGTWQVAYTGSKDLALAVEQVCKFGGSVTKTS